MISVSRPLIGVIIVCASKYEVPIHEYSDGVAPRSPAIVGRAVDKIYCSVSIQLRFSPIDQGPRRMPQGQYCLSAEQSQ